MEIKSIELKNFRNYNNEQLYFNNGINVLVGKNAQGKTNLLESIFLCAIGKSPRTAKEKELIKWDCSYAKVVLEIKHLSGHKKIEFYLFENQSKSIKVNGFSLKKIGELMGELHAVYFSPDELKLVKDSPSERRKFMDISLSQVNKNYFYNLSKYNKILTQRNKLLKASPNREVLLQTLPIWDEQLAEVGAKIIIDRKNFINKLKVFAQSLHKYLTNEKEILQLEYLSIAGKDEVEIKSNFINQLKNNIDKDFSMGFTTSGPHRDDIKILLNNIDVRNFGSQGQQRTCALSLKLSELEFFKDIFGEYPVLLLDDVLSELDDERKNKLLNKVKDFQSIISCTSFDFDVPATIFNVEKGKTTKL